MFRGVDSEFIIKAVMPDFGHTVPVINDTALDGVFKIELVSFGLDLFTDVKVFIIHANHDVFVFGFSDNGWK
jgi:hypothetical protein